MTLAVSITHVSFKYFPVTLLPAQLLVIAMAGLTRPSSIVRYTATILSGFLAVFFQVICHNYMSNAAHKQVVGTFLFLYFFLSIERLLISKWNFDAGGPEFYRKSSGKENGIVKVRNKATREGSKSSTTPWNQLVFVSDLLFGMRGIGKPWEVKHVPRYKTLPSRAKFLWDYLVLTLCIYLLVDFGGAFPPTDPEPFSVRKEALLSRITEVTGKEISLRIAASLGFWIYSYCTMASFAAVGGLLSVGIGLSSPSSWRPLFGSISEAYTIRRFWGIFWHQNLRSTFEGLSASITEKVLHLPKSVITDRYMNIFVIFFISGLIHVGTEFTAGITLKETGAIKFFSTQAFAIMFEDAVQASFLHVTGAQRGSGRPWFLWRTLGYVWTAFFFTWTTAWWAYPHARHHNCDTDNMFSFSVARQLIN